MNTMFLSLEGNVKVCCVKGEQNCFFYAERDYEDDLLDLLYNYLISCEISRVIVMLQGMWEPRLISDSYMTGKREIGKSQFFGSVNQIDVNKLSHLFKVSGINDVNYIDRFALYDAIVKHEEGPCCLIDKSFSYAFMLIAVPSYRGMVYKDLFYVLPSSLGKYVSMIKRRYDVKKFIDVASYDFGGDFGRNKFDAADAVQISHLMILSAVNSDVLVDNERIAYSSDFSSFDAPDTVGVNAVSASVGNSALSKTVDGVNSITGSVDLDEQLIDMTQESYVSPMPAKRKKSGVTIILTILIILCLLSIIGVILINYFIDGDIGGLRNRIESMSIEISNTQDMIDELDTIADAELDYTSVMNAINITEIPGIELASADINSKRCMANYYLKGRESIDVVLDELSRTFNVASITELSSSVKGSSTYYNEMIELTWLN